MQQFDLITVGDVVLDYFLTTAPSALAVQGAQSLLPHGEKILIEDATVSLGGNACNVAVGATRLGLSAALCAEIGTDLFSRYIIEQLLKEHLPLSLVIQSPTATSFAVGLQVAGDRTLFVHHVKRAHAFSFANVGTKWVYLTSLGDEWETAYAATLAFVAASGAKLAFNPGSKQMKASEKLTPIIAKSDLLFVNREEAAQLAGLQADQDMKTISSHLLQLGPKNVSITDGKNGSHFADGTTFLSIPSVPCTVVEKTGAGDAYAAGFLSAVIKGKQMAEAMHWGAQNAAGVMGYRGAQQGLLYEKNMVQSQQEGAVTGHSL